MELYEKLLHLRKERGITQDEMAEALFVSRQTVYKWETGRAVPDVTRLKQICDFYGVSADELLGTRYHASQNNVVIAEAATDTTEADAPNHVPAQKKPSRRFVIAVVAVAVALSILLLFICQPQEISKARALGIVPEGMAYSLESAVTERELLTLLANTAKLELGSDSPALTAALSNATNEQMTREKAAYWLYCAHVWTVCDPYADMTVEHRLPYDPVTQRSVYEDLNSISRARIDAVPPPWEGTLCRELRETEALFMVYDGTPSMDEQINTILYGPYYTAVTFCTAQISFLSERAILENNGDSFRTKDKIARNEAISAAYRLYGAW